MSQHYFNTQQAGTPVKVLLGWDRPLGHYFMVIEKTAAAVASESASTAAQCEGDDDDDGDDDDGYLYSNLNELDPFGLSLDHFRGVLSELHGPRVRDRRDRRDARRQPFVAPIGCRGTRCCQGRVA